MYVDFQTNFFFAGGTNFASEKDEDGYNINYHFYLAINALTLLYVRMF